MEFEGKRLDGSELRAARPTLPRVQIYLAVSGEDMVAEQQAIHSTVLPNLRRFGRENGCQVEFLDLRLNTEQSALDPAANETAFRVATTIELGCPKLFVALGGQNYGQPAMPATLKRREFDSLLAKVDKQEDCRLLRTWYKKDESSEHDTYHLQPITSRLPYYHGVADTSDHRDRRIKDRKRWEEESAKMINEFVKAAAIAHGGPDKEEVKELKRPAFAKECRGYLSIPRAGEHMVWLRREFNDRQKLLDDPSAVGYINGKVVKNQIKPDEAADALQTELHEQMGKAVNKKHQFVYPVPWRQGGIDTDKHSEHKVYISRMCTDLEESLRSMIKEVSNGLMQAWSTDESVQEAFVHAEICDSVGLRHIGLNDKTDAVMSYANSSNKHPLVVFDYTGSRDAFLANCAVGIKTKFKSSAVLLRFLGTSPQSLSSVQLVHGLCLQLEGLYPSSQPSDLPTGFFALAQRFAHLLRRATSKRPIVLILDGIESLPKHEAQPLAAWFPTVLPEHVKLIVSTCGDESADHSIAFFRQLLKGADADSFLGLRTLKEDEREGYIDSVFKDAKKNPTSKQMKALLDAVRICDAPLYVALAVETALGWRSYFQLMNTKLANKTNELIGARLGRAERAVGKVAAIRALGFICASRYGLSLNELCDVLSLDDEVLNSLNVSTFRRMPHLNVILLVEELGSLLCLRPVHGVACFGWSSNLIAAEARKRYLATPADEKRAHESLADYFSGKYGSEAKSYKDLGTNKWCNAPRYLLAQPMYWEAAVRHYNLRKCSELPYHLSRAGATSELEEAALHNFEFLLGKLSADMPVSLIEDFHLDGATESTEVIRDAVTMSINAIATQASQLPAQLSGRLESFVGHPAAGQPRVLKALLRQCQDFAQSADTFQCIPAHSCLIPPGALHKESTTFAGHKAAVMKVLAGVDSKTFYTVSLDGTIKVWGFENDKPQKVINVEGGGLLCMTSIYSDKNLVVGCVDGSCRVIDLANGTCTSTFTGHTGSIRSVAFSAASSSIATASDDGTVKLWNMSGKCTATIELTNVVSVCFARDGISTVRQPTLDKTVWADHDLSGAGKSAVDIPGEHVAFSGDSLLCMDVTGRLLEIKQGNEGETVVSAPQSQESVGVASLVKGSDSDGTIAIGTTDGSAIVVRSGKRRIHRFTSPVSADSALTSLALFADSRLVAGFADGSVRALVSFDEAVDDGVAESLASTSDAAVAVIASDRGTRIVELNSADVVAEVEAGSLVRISANDKLAAILTPDSVSLLDMATKEVTGYLDFKKGAAPAPAADSDDKDKPEGEEGEGGEAAEEAAAPADTASGASSVVDMVLVGGGSDGGSAVLGMVDGTLTVWGLTSGKVEKTIKAHDGSVLVLHANEDVDDAITSSGLDNNVKHWNLESGEMVHALGGHTKPARTVTSTDELIITGCDDTTVRIFSRKDGREVRSLPDHDLPILSVCATNNKAATCDKQEVIVWDIAASVKLARLLDLGGLFPKVCFTREDLVVTVTGRAFKVWSADGNCTSTFQADHRITGFACPPSAASSIAVLSFEGAKATTLMLPVPPKSRARQTGVSIFGAMGAPDLASLLGARKGLNKTVVTPKIEHRVNANIPEDNATVGATANPSARSSVAKIEAASAAGGDDDEGDAEKEEEEGEGEPAPSTDNSDVSPSRSKPPPNRANYATLKRARTRLQVVAADGTAVEDPEATPEATPDESDAPKKACCVIC